MRSIQRIEYHEDVLVDPDDEMEAVLFDGRETLRWRSCQRGHVWSEENTYTRPDGTRECRACRKLRGA